MQAAPGSSIKSDWQPNCKSVRVPRTCHSHTTFAALQQMRRARQLTEFQKRRYIHHPCDARAQSARPLHFEFDERAENLNQFGSKYYHVRQLFQQSSRTSDGTSSAGFECASLRLEMNNLPQKFCQTLALTESVSDFDGATAVHLHNRT